MVAIESTLLMGAVLLGIVIAVGLGRDWERTPTTGEDQVTTLVNLFKQPITWSVLFVVAVLLFAIGALAYVDGPNVLGLGQAAGELLLIAGSAVSVVMFVFGGLYAAYRNRGLKQAQAVGVSSVLLGLILVGVIGVMLLTS